MPSAKRRCDLRCSAFFYFEQSALLRSQTRQVVGRCSFIYGLFRPVAVIRTAGFGFKKLSFTSTSCTRVKLSSLD